MTPAELQELLEESPYLYHMAMKDSWPLVKQYGLLPTNDLLQMFEVDHELFDQLTTQRRPASVDIEHSKFGYARIRDQIPLDDKGLLKALTGGLTPADWYRRLNERIFFWLTEERLNRLMCAGTYRLMDHIVLKVPTAPIVENYREQIELSPMNSGCTKPFPHPRGEDTFLSIDDYPYSFWKNEKRRRPGERVVELTVIGGVPDIANYVEEVWLTGCGKPRQQVGP